MHTLSRLHPSNIAVRLEKSLFRSARALGVGRLLFPDHMRFMAFRHDNKAISSSQIGQDLFVLWALGMKQDGFFVEVGAASGVALSNTYLLERQFGWRGICAEPGRNWHPQLQATRRCIVDKRCVWSQSGAELDFMECADGEFSTLASHATSDGHQRVEASGGRYAVETVSLVDLLDQYHAPQMIDYLSIDTEGSELEILKAHDFNRYQFRALTVEHNNVADRRVALAQLLSSWGYRRVLPSLSAFDDWYLLQSETDFQPDRKPAAERH